MKKNNTPTDDYIGVLIFKNHLGYGETINVKKTHQYSGSEIVFEGMYATFSHELVARLGVNSPINVKTENNYSAATESTSDVIISEMALGYHYKNSDHSGIILEAHVIPPFNLPDAVALFNTMPPHANSIHMGSYYQVKNPKHGFWNNLNVRCGGYLKQLDFSGRNILITDLHSVLAWNILLIHRHWI